MVTAAHYRLQFNSARSSSWYGLVMQQLILYYWQLISTSNHIFLCKDELRDRMLFFCVLDVRARSLIIFLRINDRTCAPNVTNNAHASNLFLLILVTDKTFSYNKYVLGYVLGCVLNAHHPHFLISSVIYQSYITSEVVIPGLVVARWTAGQ